MATTAVLTAKGRDITTAAINGTTASEKVIGWGLNPGALNAAASDVAMFKEAPEARVTGTATVVTTTTTNDTYQVTGSITCTQGGGETIAECVVADSTTKPFSTTWATAPSGTAGTSGTLSASYTPANNTYIQDQSGEVMEVTAGSGTTSVTVTRGANGSTAVSSANGNTVTQGAVPGSSVTGGNVLMHATFTGLALNDNDSITFTCQVKFT